jgi:hypothetical protein
MSAPVWQATRELAGVWSASPFIQQYAAVAAGLDMANMTSSALHVQAQPLFLSEYLHTVIGYEQFIRAPGARAWLGHGRQIALGFTPLIEWLRSRLTGYPFTDAPQLRPNSPWTTLNVSMRTAWFPELRDWRLHERDTPPIMPFLSGQQEGQLRAGAALGAAIRASPAAARLDAAWRELHETDFHQLAGACTALDRTVHPIPAGQTDGHGDFLATGFCEAHLDAVLRPLRGPAKTFTDALNDAERLIQQASALFSQLVVYATIRAIDNVVLVEQFDGSTGWHTVRGDSPLPELVRQREIVSFDHPHPRGLMLVEGVTDHFSGRHVTVTVAGRLLPESHEFA